MAVRFTDSPYEVLMTEQPEAGYEKMPLPYPVGHPCSGCPYGRVRPCIGTCMKNLFPMSRGRRGQTHEAEK